VSGARERSVGEARLHRGGSGIGASVDPLPHRRSVETAPAGDGVHQRLEQIVGQRFELLTLLRRHAFAGEAIAGGLVGADAHHLGPDLEPLQQGAQVQAVDAQAHQQQGPRLRQPQPGGSAGHHQGLGPEQLPVGHHRLAALAHGLDGAAQGERTAPALQGAREAQQHPHDPGVLGRRLQRRQRVEQAQGRMAGEGKVRRRELLQGRRQAEHQPRAPVARERRAVGHPPGGPHQVRPRAPHHSSRADPGHQRRVLRRPFR
jgi:hypothetical protein